MSRTEDDELRRWLLSLRPADYPLVFPGRTREDAEAETERVCSPKNRKAFRLALGAVLLAWQREFSECHDHDWSAEQGRDSEKERQILPARNPETGKRDEPPEVTLDRLQMTPERERSLQATLRESAKEDPASETGDFFFYHNVGPRHAWAKVRKFSSVPAKKIGLIERLLLLYLQDDKLGTSARARQARLLRVRLMLLDAGVERDPPDSWATIARDFGTTVRLARRTLLSFRRNLPDYLRDPGLLSPAEYRAAAVRAR